MQEFVTLGSEAIEFCKPFRRDLTRSKQKEQCGEGQLSHKTLTKLEVTR